MHRHWRNTKVEATTNDDQCWVWVGRQRSETGDVAAGSSRRWCGPGRRHGWAQWLQRLVDAHWRRLHWHRLLQQVQVVAHCWPMSEQLLARLGQCKPFPLSTYTQQQFTSAPSAKFTANKGWSISFEKHIVKYFLSPICLISYGLWVPSVVRRVVNCYTPFTFTSAVKVNTLCQTS